MSRDGPPTLTLSERMRQRIEDETQLLEGHRAALTTMLERERSAIAQSLKSASEDVRRAMQSSTAEAMTEMQSYSASSKLAIADLKATIARHSTEGLKDYQASIARLSTNAARSFQELLKGARLTFLLSGAILISAAAILAGMTWWTRWDLSATQAQLASEKQALADIRKLTGHIRITADGQFVVLPRGAEVNWTCDGQPCVKISGR